MKEILKILFPLVVKVDISISVLPFSSTTVKYRIGNTKNQHDSMTG